MNLSDNLLFRCRYRGAIWQRVLVKLGFIHVAADWAGQAL